MHSIALVSCVKGKTSHACKAKDLYQSDWFYKARSLAESKFDAWYILSAEHYLLDPEKQIEPYEKTLNKMAREDRVNWALRVYAMILDIERPDLITFLAGNRYREFLAPMLIKNGFSVAIPMDGMGIGRQLAWMRNPTAFTVSK